MIITPASLTTLFTAFKAAFNTGFRSYTPLWSQVATLVPSTTSTEEYGWLGQFPRLREWVGDRHIKNMAAHAYSIKNKKFEATVAVDRDKVEDDTYGLYAPLMQEMGHAAATHPDELVFALLAAGFSAAGYDGQPFFDADHPVLDEHGEEQSVSNTQSGSGSPWFLLDARRPLKPLIFQRRRDYDFRALNRLDDDHVFKRDEYVYGVDARANVGFGFWQQAFGSKATLDEANFSAAYAAMLAFKSDQGRPLGIMPNLLVTGPSNRDKAHKVIKAELVLEGGAGVTNINKDVVDVLIVPWLA